MNIQYLKLIAIYLILLQFIQIVISDDPLCSGCKVDNNKCINVSVEEDTVLCNYNEYYCKPNKENNKCFDCSNALKSSLSKYYSIENDICIGKSGSDCKKIIIETNQCVDACPEYEFGDFCYQQCYNSEEGELNLGLETESNEPTKKCKCKEDKYLIEEKINEKIYKRCVDSCPSGFFDVNTRKCVDKCEGSTNKITPENGCTNMCLDNQFLFEQTETINGVEITQLYCVSKCPDEARFFYQNSPPNQERKCLKECNQNHFYSIKKVMDGDNIKYENQCLESCNGISKIDYSANIFQCDETTIEPTTEPTCDESFPYKYKEKSCLRECSDTQKLQMFENKITYFLIDNNKKICSEECQESDSDKHFKDSKTLSCHSTCEETSNKFNFNNECVNSCEEPHPYHLYDTGTCVTKCEDGNNDDIKYYLLREEKTCYTKPPNGTEYKYLDIVNNEWNTCKIPKNPESPSYGEGFIFDNKCYKSCKDIRQNDESTDSEYKYYRINDNNCIKDCKSNEDIYKYSKGDIENETDEANKKYICYSSCKDIPGDYIYEYDFMCYSIQSDLPTDKSEYYYSELGIRQYFKNNVELDKECSKLGLYYLKDKECVNDCSEGEYRELFSTDQSGRIETLGNCWSDGCHNKYLIFSGKQKNCFENCPYKEIKKESSESTAVITEENCVIQCPSGYPYESFDGKYCKKNCDDTQYFIENEGKKLCVPNCKDYSKFYFNGDKMCVDQCIKQINGKNYYYYYNSDNKCLENCIGNKENGKDIEFALKAENSPQRCIENCSGLDKHKYYFNENKICLNKCINGFIKSEGESECVSSCNDISKPFVVNNTTCSDACPETEPFIAEVSFGILTIKKCTSNCEFENSIYKFHYCKEENGKKICECLQSCGTVLYEYGKECLDDCPPGFYKESKKCLTKCSSKYFYKNETTGVYECKESCDGNNKYITSNNECVSRCPINENFIGADNICKSKCDPDVDGEYYTILPQEEGVIAPKYNIYNCSKEKEAGSCPLILDGTNECVLKCPDDKPYKSPDSICYSTCLKSTSYPFTVPKEFSNEDTKENECAHDCPGTANYYYEDKICTPECKKLVNIKDKSCVNKCDNTSTHKYSNGTHCIDSCNRYTINDYICYDGKECPKPYNYISGSICSDKCPENEFANPIYVTNGGVESVNEYTCKSSCDSGLYTYNNTKICLKECGTNQYEVQDEKKCVDSCNEVSTTEKPYFFYEKKDENSPFKKNTCVLHCPDDKPYIDIDNHCSENCSFAGYKYYLYSNKTCVDKCPTGYKKNGLECVLECPQNSEEEKYLYLDETDTCIESCEGSKGGYYYFYKTDRKCLKKCNDNDFMNNFECVSSCPEGSSYIYKQKCLDICPSNQKYYIVFENGEHKTNKYCNRDCSVDYQFYVEKENGNYECQGSCSDYYITNKDPNIIAKKCVSSCKYYVNINETHKECFDLCPNGKRYYVNEGEDKNQCYEKCPQETPYHIKDNFQCLKNCDSKFVNETNGECISSCGISNRFWIKKKIDVNEEITVCLKNCSEVNLKYYTPEGECNDTCDDTKFLKGIKKDNEFICECMNLYYFNDEGVKTCINNETLKCGETGKDSENYPYQVDGTNQCVKNCLGVLSPAEDICYLGTSINEKDICPPNTEKGIFGNKIKCDCKYKYYLDENDNKKICLNENEKCPTEYNYLVQDKNECVKSCDGYNVVFDNKCLDNCPVGMDEENTENGKSCKCRKYWFKELENKYTCVEQCNDKYPYLIEETNECVKNCNETKYNIMHNNKCISSCGENMTVVQLDDGKTSCLCNYLWIEGGECKKDNIDKKCIDLDENMIYLIKKTNQCVKNCPEGYNYFNHECFSSCNEANNYGYDLEEKSSSKECICKKFWKYNDINIKVCVDECGDNEFLMNSTSQCIVKSDNFKCPHDSPYFYNNICYSMCPVGTKIDNINGDACICKNKWFKRDDGLINCFVADEICPEAYPYLINITKECVKEEKNCDDQNYPKIFNYVCYSNCPFSTKDNDNKCECDNTKGYWYIDIPNQENPREYYACNLEKCPNERKYFINGTNECISKCSDRELYEYSNICYDQCPLLITKSKNGYTCEFSTEAETIKDLVGNISEKIVDLYPELSENGLVINNEEASLQIYGLKNGQDKKEAIKRSNLAFLDLSGCLEKIYKSNHMSGDDEIIVIKLDLKSKNAKLIINPVEYQFIHSRTGEILDASVCEKNEVVISYPITYLLKTKKKLRNLEISEEEQEEILDKFNKGKLIYEGDNSIDSFNYNSSIYTDICIPVEIEGKDLSLEDRINYLFPNYSLCESICIYDYTDFIDERIYCNCSIKSEIDVDREQPVKLVQINKNETDNNQKGPTNLPVLKCISNAKIPGNGAFYFCLIIIIVEVGLLVLAILYSFSSLVRKVKKRIIKNNGGDIYSSNNNNVNNIEYNESEGDKINKGRNNKFNNYMNDKKTIIKSTDRNLNNQNPPKRRSEEEKDEELNIDNNPINVNKNVYKNDIKEKNVKIDEKNNYDVFSERVDNNIDLDQYLRNNGIETEKGFLFSMREEVNLLRTNYKYSLKNDKFDSIVIVLTSVFDKIYFIRILLLPGKFEIIPLMFSLYLLCHMMLLTFLGFFYDIKTIKKIWNEENYPNTGYYLLYGFLANLIVWVIYRLLCCLLNNEYKIKKLDNIAQLDKDKKKKKISNCIYSIKRNIIIYFVLQFVLIMFCSFYLITFCGIYTGTKSKLFQSYGIAFIEIIIIKIIYGFILGILRKLSLAKESTCMYKLILIFNQYLS